MIKCVQCGLVQKPGPRCERCAAVLERPDLAVPAATPPAAPAPGLQREIPLDRRAAEREVTAPPAAPAPPRRLPVPPTPAPSTRPAPVAPEPRPAASPPADARAEGVEVFRASPAPFFKRAAAWLVDALFIGLVLALYLKIAQALMTHPPPPTSETGLDLLVNRADAYQGVLKYGLLLGVTVGFVYSALFHAMGGRTPGKRLLGIRLVDRSGRAPTLTRCVVRAGLSVLSFALLLLGFFYAGFDRRRQALHDKLTATFVVRPLA